MHALAHFCDGLSLLPQGRWAREDYALLQPAMPFPATPLFVTMHMVKAAAGKRELEVRPLCYMSCIIAFYYTVACRLSASAISGMRTIAVHRCSPHDCSRRCVLTRPARLLRS